MVIKNYLNSKKQEGSDETSKKSDCRVCMQLLKPESIMHYELSLNSEDVKNDQIVCIEAMKLSLLAKSCLCPGLVVLVSNLIKSNNVPESELKDDRLKRNEDKENSWAWLNQYVEGKKFEIYRIPIPARRAG